MSRRNSYRQFLRGGCSASCGDNGEFLPGRFRGILIDENRQGTALTWSHSSGFELKNRAGAGEIEAVYGKRFWAQVLELKGSLEFAILERGHRKIIFPAPIGVELGRKEKEWNRKGKKEFHLRIKRFYRCLYPFYVPNPFSQVFP